MTAKLIDLEEYEAIKMFVETGRSPENILIYKNDKTNGFALKKVKVKATAKVAKESKKFKVNDVL